MKEIKSCNNCKFRKVSKSLSYGHCLDEKKGNRVYFTISFTVCKWHRNKINGDLK